MTGIPTTGRVGRIARAIEKETDRATVEKVMLGVADCISTSSYPKKAKWVKGMIVRLESQIGPERTNPRTLAQFFRDMKRIPDLSSEGNQNRFKMMASSLLDDQTVSSMMVFMERDVEMVLEPSKILHADKDDWDFIEKHVDRMMAGKEKRIDVIGVTCDRLYAYLVQPTTKPEKKTVENFQRFLTMDKLPEDIRHNLCLRMARVKDGGETHQWILQNKKLTEMIMNVL